MAIDPSDILLTGRVAVVTGAGAGIGRAIAAGMTAFGARVAIWEGDPQTCAQAAESIGALGIVTDVRDTGQGEAALQRTTAELGPVTILVNNAGGVFSSPLLETGENGWDALYRANLRHVLLCTQRVVRQPVAAGLPGSIISVTSIGGVRAAPGYAAYAAAKAGVINYTKTAALELAAPRHPGQRNSARYHAHRRAGAPQRRGDGDRNGQHRAAGPSRPCRRDRQCRSLSCL